MYSIDTNECEWQDIKIVKRCHTTSSNTKDVIKAGSERRGFTLLEEGEGLADAGVDGVVAEGGIMDVEKVREVEGCCTTVESEDAESVPTVIVSVAEEEEESVRDEGIGMADVADGTGEAKEPDMPSSLTVMLAPPSY